MTVCDCKCHQMPGEKSNCAKCGNTGTVIDPPKAVQDITFIPVKDKPIYPKGTTSL